MDIQAVEQGLANAADTIAGLRCFPSLPDAIEPPAFGVAEVEIVYNRTFGSTGGLSEVLFTCGVITSRGNTDAGRKALNGYLAETGAGSVKAALEADRTLAGVAKTLNVERARGAYRLYEFAGVQYLGAMYDVRVWS